MRTKLHSLFIGLAIIAGVIQATAQVTNLGIAPIAGSPMVWWQVDGSSGVAHIFALLRSLRLKLQPLAFSLQP